jgi:hypothetical protein
MVVNFLYISELLVSLHESIKQQNNILNIFTLIDFYGPRKGNENALCDKAGNKWKHFLN